MALKSHPLTLCALLVGSGLAFCQPAPPLLPAVQLNQWVLAQPDWADVYGDAALGFSALNVAPGWSEAGTALSLDTNCPAFLDLDFSDRFDEPSILFAAGTISLWFQPN
jgi:hypothetical protein